MLKRKLGISQGLFLSSLFLLFLLWWYSLLSFAWFFIFFVLLIPITREIADLLIQKYKLGIRPSVIDNVAIVTGASRGIGRYIALQLVQDGFHVFAGVRREEDGKSLESE